MKAVNLSIIGGLLLFSWIPLAFFITADFSYINLLPFVKEGKVFVHQELLIMETNYSKTSIDLPISLLEKIKKAAKGENQSISLWIEKVIEEYFENNEHDKYKF